MHIILGILIVGLIIWAFNIDFKRFIRGCVYLSAVGAVMFVAAGIYLTDPPAKEVKADSFSDIEQYRVPEPKVDPAPAKVSRWEQYAETPASAPAKVSRWEQYREE